jgi:trans-aconitate methyltransferase
MKWNPEDYAKNSDAQLKWAKELKQSLNLQGDESVLDVGVEMEKSRLTLQLLYPEAEWLV